MANSDVHRGDPASANETPRLDPPAIFSSPSDGSREAYLVEEMLGGRTIGSDSYQCDRRASTVTWAHRLLRRRRYTS